MLTAWTLSCHAFRHLDGRKHRLLLLRLCRERPQVRLRCAELVERAPRAARMDKPPHDNLRGPLSEGGPGGPPGRLQDILGGCIGARDQTQVPKGVEVSALPAGPGDTRARRGGPRARWGPRLTTRPRSALWARGHRLLDSARLRLGRYSRRAASCRPRRAGRSSGRRPSPSRGLSHRR